MRTCLLGRSILGRHILGAVYSIPASVRNAAKDWKGTPGSNLGWRPRQVSVRTRRPGLGTSPPRSGRTPKPLQGYPGPQKGDGYFSQRRAGAGRSVSLSVSALSPRRRDGRSRAAGGGRNRRALARLPFQVGTNWSGLSEPGRLTKVTGATTGPPALYGDRPPGEPSGAGRW